MCFKLIGFKCWLLLVYENYTSKELNIFKKYCKYGNKKLTFGNKCYKYAYNKMY